MKKNLIVAITLTAIAIFTPIFYPLINNMISDLDKTDEADFILSESLSISLPSEFTTKVHSPYIIEYSYESETVLIQAYSSTVTTTAREDKEMFEAIYQELSQDNEYSDELISSEIIPSSDGDIYKQIMLVNSVVDASRQTSLYKIFNDTGIRLTYIQRKQDNDEKYIGTINPQNVFNSIVLE